MDEVLKIKICSSDAERIHVAKNDYLGISLDNLINKAKGLDLREYIAEQVTEKLLKNYEKYYPKNRTHNLVFLTDVKIDKLKKISEQ